MTDANGRFKIAESPGDPGRLIRVFANSFVQTRILELPRSLIASDLGSITLYKPSKLIGTVTSENGHAIEDVTIHAYDTSLEKLTLDDQDAKWAGLLGREFGISNSNKIGDYEFADMESAHEVDLILEKPGFSTVVKHVRIEPEQIIRADIILPNEVKFCGIVVDESGKAIPGAFVEQMITDRHFVRWHFFTDPNGRFVIPGLTATPNLALRVRGTHYKSKTWEANQFPLNHEFHLARASEVELKFDTSSKRNNNKPYKLKYRLHPWRDPIESGFAFIREHGTNDPPPQPDMPLQMKRNHFSEFLFKVECNWSFPHGTSLELECPRDAPLRAVAVNLYECNRLGWSEPFLQGSPDDPPPTIPVIIQKNADFHGFLRSTDGQPAAGTRMTCTRWLFDRIKLKWSIDCDVDGSFEFLDIPEGTYQLRGSSPSFELQPTNIVIVSGVDAPVELKARRAARVHGKLTIAGKSPIALFPSGFVIKTKRGKPRRS